MAKIAEVDLHKKLKIFQGLTKISDDEFNVLWSKRQDPGLFIDDENFLATDNNLLFIAYNP